MAHLSRPFDPEDPGKLIRVFQRETDDLPAHVKGAVIWQQAYAYHPAGYYLNQQPVEFIENFWHYLYSEGEYAEFFFTTLEDRIEPFTATTGYWHLSDPQHPDHIPSAPVASTSALTLDTDTPRRTTSLLTGDPDLSPYLSTVAGVRISPRLSPDSKSDSKGDSSESDSPRDIPVQSPQEQQQEEVLAAQF
jgi:hypothetical protein